MFIQPAASLVGMVFGDEGI